MQGSLTREKGLKWTAYVLVALLVAAGAYAGMLFLQVDEAEQSAVAARKAADDASGAAARANAQIKILTAKASESEQKARELDVAKALLAKLEPEVVPALEASSKTGKPSTRAAALATIGIIGQLVHGPKHEAALNAFDRALLADKDNCPAALAMKLSGEKDLEVSPECQGLLPASITAGASDKPGAKPAPAAAPAAAAPAPAPAPAKADEKKAEDKK
jgi:hypothetical protein